MLRCVVFGHRHRFTAEGATLRWRCERCGNDGGAKEYPSAEAAGRYAAWFDRRDSDDLGRRSPMSLIPLRLARRRSRRGTR